MCSSEPAGRGVRFVHAHETHAPGHEPRADGDEVAHERPDGVELPDGGEAGGEEDNEGEGGEGHQGQRAVVEEEVLCFLSVVCGVCEWMIRR